MASEAGFPHFNYESALKSFQIELDTQGQVNISETSRVYKVFW